MSVALNACSLRFSLSIKWPVASISGSGINLIVIECLSSIACINSLFSLSKYVASLTGRYTVNDFSTWTASSSNILTKDIASDDSDFIYPDPLHVGQTSSELPMIDDLSFCLEISINPNLDIGLN